MKCPGCRKENDDDWPITVEGVIRSGGCQECWEAECDRFWWEMVKKIQGGNYD